MLANERRPQRRTKAGRLVSSITYEELSLYFHLPSEKACKELGVGLTILKRVCRKLGIPRWPYNRVPKAQQDCALGASPVRSANRSMPAALGRQLPHHYFPGAFPGPLPLQQQPYSGSAPRQFSALPPHQQHLLPLAPTQQQYGGSHFAGPGFAAAPASASAFKALNLRSNYSVPPDLSRLATHPDAQPLLRQQYSGDSAQTHSANSHDPASPQQGATGPGGRGAGRAGQGAPAEAQLLEWLKWMQAQQGTGGGSAAPQQQQQQQLFVDGRFAPQDGHSAGEGAPAQERRRREVVKAEQEETGEEGQAPLRQQGQQQQQAEPGAGEGEEFDGELETAMARLQDLLHRLTGTAAGAEQQQQPLQPPAPAPVPVQNLEEMLRPGALPWLLQAADSGLASNYANAVLGALVQHAQQSQQQQAQQVLAPRAMLPLQAGQRPLATTYSSGPHQGPHNSGLGGRGSQTPPPAMPQPPQMDAAMEQLAMLLQQAVALAGLGRQGEWGR